MNDSPRVLGNRYQVGDLLGRGGMAEVHQGRDTRLGRSVAIKLLRTDLARDPTFQARFRREAQSAAALNHPAIVSVYDTGEEQVVEAGGAVVNLPYIVMEYVAGRTLRDLLAEHHHLDVDFALEITAGVLSALEYSHRIGIVHRDIKPANVMLTPTGDVKVMDFGIARAMADASSTMTQTQAVIGTAQYLSPEQARGEQVDTRSDLYSAGCLLFELLTGRPPFVADSPVAVAYQHVREQPPAPSQLVPGIPEAVDRIVLHSLAKGREERYQTAADFRADVEAARGGRQVMASIPASSASAATTQFAPPPETGTTRVMGYAAGPGPVGGGPLLGQTGAGGYPPAYDPEQDYRRRDQRQPPASRRGPIIAGIAIVVIAALAGFFLIHTLNGDKDEAASTEQIPSVAGQLAAVAVDTLSKAGFTVAPKLVEETSATVKAGRVTRTDPAEGTSVPTTQQITLFVSSGTGETQVTVPNLVGQTQEQAAAALAKINLKLGESTTGNDVTQKPEHIFKTEPAGGDSAPTGSTVDIFLSSTVTTVPKVVGLSRDDAHSALKKADLKWKDTEEKTGDGEPDQVVDQSLADGLSIRRGQTVELTIAEPPDDQTPSPSATTPPVTPNPSGTSTP